MRPCALPSSEGSIGRHPTACQLRPQYEVMWEVAPLLLCQFDEEGAEAFLHCAARGGARSSSDLDHKSLSSTLVWMQTTSLSLCSLWKNKNKSPAEFPSLDGNWRFLRVSLQGKGKRHRDLLSYPLFQKPPPVPRGPQRRAGYPTGGRCVPSTYHFLLLAPKPAPKWGYFLAE